MKSGARVYGETSETVVLPNDVAMSLLETHYRWLMENACDPIFVVDAHTGLILEVNQKTCDMVGYPREALVGHPQTKLHPPPLATSYDGIFQRHVQGLNATEAERVVFLQHAQGYQVPCHINSTVLALGDRRLVYAIARDLGPILQVQDELRYNREMLAALFKHSPDALLLCEGSGLIIDASHRAEQLFLSNTDESLLGLFLADLQPQPTASNEAQPHWLLYRDGQGRQFWGNTATTLFSLHEQPRQLLRILDVGTYQPASEPSGLVS